VSGTCIAADNLSVVTNLALYGVSLLIWHQFRVVSASSMPVAGPLFGPLSLGVWQGYCSGEKVCRLCFDVGLSLGILW